MVLIGPLPSRFIALTAKAKTEALLALLVERKQGMIDRIIEIQDEELARKMLPGN
jgi:hypothetical protein